MLNCEAWWSQWTFRFLVGATAVLALAQTDVRAEAKAVGLASTFADFALNPETGQVAAIDAERGTAALFTLKDSKAEQVATATVGATPVSICFKRFGSKSYFAVVCSQESNFTLLNAADLTRAAKIPTSGAGTSLVFCSLNPEDPFVYYTYGSGHDSRCGVIDVRNMSDAGTAFASIMDGAISASGRFGYQRGPWSPSGFTSFRMTSSFAAKKPVFQIEFSEHRSVHPYLPDPFDSYTAVGCVLHTADLTRQVASINLNVVAFASARPLVFGMQVNDSFGRADQNKPLVLQAASYNTFQITGEPVTLPVYFGIASTPLPRGVAGQADFKAVATRNRFLPDDKRQQLLCCSRNQIVPVPYDEFKAAEEPFLQLAMKSPEVVRIGTASEFAFSLTDDKVEVEFTGLPDGAKAEKLKVTWSPEPAQLGTHTITARLKSGDLERIQTFNVEAANESILLPFSPNGMVMNPAGTIGVCWQSLQNNSDGVITETRLATVDVRGRKVLASKADSLRIQGAAVSDKHVFLYEPNGSFIQIHDLLTLARVKTVYAYDLISRLTIYRDDTLLALGPARTSVFNVSNFSRKKLPTDATLELSSLGPVWGQAVLDDKLEKPRLLLGAAGVFSLDGESGALNRSNFSHKMLGEPQQQPPQQNVGRRGPLEQAGVLADQPAYRARIEFQAVPNGKASTNRMTVLLQDWVRGSLIQKVPVAVRSSYQNPRGGSNNRLIVPLADQVLVGWEDELYPIPLPKPLPPEFRTGITLRPDHSHQTFQDAKDGVLTLPHVATGGSGQKTFSLRFAPSGLEIDQSTGVVTVRWSELSPRVVDFLQKMIPVGPGSEPAASIANYRAGAAEALKRHFGREPDGVPILLPIAVRVQDEDAQSTELRYSVLIEAPVEPLMERLTKVYQTEVAKAATMKTSVTAPQHGDNPLRPKQPAADADEVRKLREKIETLDARVDLLTRQMAELIKKLDEQNQKK